MKRRIGLIMAVLMLACSAPGQADEAAAIKKNLEQMWSDVAQGKIDASNFGEGTLTAYSSGGLWQSQSGKNEGKVVVPNYRTRISQVMEKRGNKWLWVGTHASPLFGGSGVVD